MILTTQSGGTGGWTAVYRVVNQWTGGFHAEVVVTNGPVASTAWTVGWTFANGQTVTQIWSGQDTPNGASHNASTSFGFLGSWNGTNSVPTTTCTRS